MDIYENYNNSGYDDNDDEYIDHSPMDPLGILIDKKFKREDGSMIDSYRSYEDMEISNSCIKNADLRYVTFRNVTFFNVIFFKGILNNVRFENCTLFNVEMTNKPELNIVFHNCILINCDIQCHMPSDDVYKEDNVIEIDILREP